MISKQTREILDGKGERALSSTQMMQMMRVAEAARATRLGKLGKRKHELCSGTDLGQNQHLPLPSRIRHRALVNKERGQQHNQRYATWQRRANFVVRPESRR